MLSNRAGRILRDAGVRNSITGCGHGVRHQPTTFRLEPAELGDDSARVVVDGVRWCGNSRCPRCAPLVASVVSERIGILLGAARAKRVGVAMLTCTAGHDPTTLLADMRFGLSSAFQAMQHGRPWKRLKAAGLLGVVRVWEVTYGFGGWHLHAHVLVFHRDGSAAAVDAGRELSATWIGLVTSRGFRAVAEAQDCRAVLDGEALADYGAKALRGWDVSAELAAGWAKGGRRPDRLSMPQVLGLAAHGDAWAARAYVEAVTALKGMRVLVVGPALKAALGVDFEDVTDEEAIKPESQSGRVLGEMPASSWSRACVRCLAPWVLAEIERLSVRQGIEWRNVLRHLEDGIWKVAGGPDPPDG